MRNLRPGHLKGTVTDQHQRPQPARRLQPNRTRDRKTHGCIVGWANADISSDVDCCEETVARVAHHGKLGVTAHEVVEDVNQMSNANGFVFGVRFKDFWRDASLPSGHAVLSPRQSRRLHQSFNEASQWHVMKYVMLDEDFARYA